MIAITVFTVIWTRPSIDLNGIRDRSYWVNELLNGDLIQLETVDLTGIH
jgi:hypothetical protein